MVRYLNVSVHTDDFYVTTMLELDLGFRLTRPLFKRHQQTSGKTVNIPEFIYLVLKLAIPDIITWERKFMTAFAGINE